MWTKEHLRKIIAPYAEIVKLDWKTSKLVDLVKACIRVRILSGITQRYMAKPKEGIRK